jgi:hypothetical protein
VSVRVASVRNAGWQVQVSEHNGRLSAISGRNRKMSKKAWFAVICVVGLTVVAFGQKSALKPENIGITALPVSSSSSLGKW